MKKLILLSILSFICLNLSAVEPGTRFGIRYDVGINTINGVKGNRVDYRLGDAITGILQCNTKDLFFQTGIGLQQKSFHIKGITGNYNPVYLNVPIYVGYYFCKDAPVSPVIMAGTTLSCGLFKIGGNEFEGNYWDSLHRLLNADIGLRAGVEIKNHFQITAGVEYGITEATKYDNGHYLGINIAFAYMF